MDKVDKDLKVIFCMKKNTHIWKYLAYYYPKERKKKFKYMKTNYLKIYKNPYPLNVDKSNVIFLNPS